MKYGLVLFLIVLGILIWVGRPSSIPQSVPESSRQQSTLQSEPKKIDDIENTVALATSKEDFAKLEILEEILKTKNDNDPRLDKEFKNLSNGAKELLREKYTALPAEKRNEKGTVVFLLGKNLKEADDFRFLEKVLSEPPCYNLANCKDSGGVSHDSGHDEMGAAVTLAYPQLVSLKVVERYLADKNPENNRKDLAMRVIESGKTSPVKAVSNLAEKLAVKFP
jgi:hypothetical protein